MPSERGLGSGPRAPSDAVQDRLIDAAERLVALHTDEGTSSRAIIAAAGQRHNSAITYHFGDRRGLLDAVWERRSAVVNRRRLELVATWSGREPELRELVEAWVRPFAEFIGARRPSYWARFNEDELRRYPLAMVPQLCDRILPVDRRRSGCSMLIELFEQIEQRICASPEGSIRISSAIRMVISAFAAWERDAEAGRQTISADDLGVVMVECVLGLLDAAAPTSRRRRSAHEGDDRRDADGDDDHPVDHRRQLAADPGTDLRAEHRTDGERQHDPPVDLGDDHEDDAGDALAIIDQHVLQRVDPGQRLGQRRPPCTAITSTPWAAPK